MAVKISIIVPVYNVAPYIQACLDSIGRQSYKDIEVIFVDDRGTDDSIRMIKETLASCPFPPHKIVTHTHNRGLSAARNTGLDAATGEYVYFLDSDDEISETCLERLAAPLDKKRYEVVIGGVREQCADPKNVATPLREGEIARPLKSYAEGGWYVMAWNKLCDRNFLISNDLYFKEGMLHEDVAWSFQLACLCRSMYAVGEITYYYRIRGASIMTSMSIEKDVRIYLEAFAEIRDFILRRQFMYDSYAYRMVEGKKSGILYSLLQKGENGIYRKYYPLFYRLNHISPWVAYKQEMIGISYLLRDLHYLLPPTIGRIYKKYFYLLFYKSRGKQIKGAIWK